MNLHKPFFIAALVCILLCVLVEIGASLFLPRAVASRANIEASLHTEGAQGSVSVQDVLKMQSGNPPTPGLGIPYQALVDGLLLFTLLLMSTSLVLPDSLQGQVQGVVSLVCAVLTLLAGIVMLFAAVGLLLLMVSLFLAAPFGTIAYLALWGFFNRGDAAITLGLLMLLKLAAALCLVMAQPRFIQNKGLVLLFVTSVLSTALVSFLHGFVPSPLVSITDALGAIIVALLGLLWAVVLLVGAIISVIRVITLKRSAGLLSNKSPAPQDNDKGVSLEQLRRIMPGLPLPKGQQYLPYLNSAMAEAQIDTPKREAAFLAQLAHESGELRYMEELASGAAYEGRKDLGNTEPGDGKRYKGRGPIQLTGRNNYRAAGKALGLDLEQQPARAADPDVGFRTAAWFWTTHGLNTLADLDNFREITHRINGGYNGEASREAYYQRALATLKA